MVLENMIVGVQITDRNHPIRILTITLGLDIVIGERPSNNPQYIPFTTIINDVHTLYRLVARKQTGKKGIKLPREAIPPGPVPDWVGQSDYCCVFVDREGERCVDLTLSDAHTLVLNNAAIQGGKEMELFYEALCHYVPHP